MWKQVQLTKIRYFPAALDQTVTLSINLSKKRLSVQSTILKMLQMYELIFSRFRLEYIYLYIFTDSLHLITY